DYYDGDDDDDDDDADDDDDDKGGDNDDADDDVLLHGLLHYLLGLHVQLWRLGTLCFDKLLATI
ncbi:MAG TPA: hypothetical protein QF838_01645, partial [SAR202 cluster bacterium]|nr:hypothetical protein [SAR202 cluster bacterium]